MDEREEGGSVKGATGLLALFFPFLCELGASRGCALLSCGPIFWAPSIAADSGHHRDSASIDYV